MALTIARRELSENPARRRCDNRHASIDFVGKDISEDP
jgi:hypothetical protein